MLLDDLLITITKNNVNNVLQRSQSPLSLKVIAGVHGDIHRKRLKDQQLAIQLVDPASLGWFYLLFISLMLVKQ